MGFRRVKNWRTVIGPFLQVYCSLYYFIRPKCWCLLKLHVSDTVSNVFWASFSLETQNLSLYVIILILQVTKVSLEDSMLWIYLALWPIVSAYNSYFAHSCDEVTDKKQLRERSVYLSSQSEGYSLPSGQGVTMSASTTWEAYGGFFTSQWPQDQAGSGAGLSSLKPAHQLLTSACDPPPPETSGASENSATSWGPYTQTHRPRKDTSYQTVILPFLKSVWLSGHQIYTDSASADSVYLSGSGFLFRFQRKLPFPDE